MKTLARAYLLVCVTFLLEVSGCSKEQAGGVHDKTAATGAASRAAMGLAKSEAVADMAIDATLDAPAFDAGPEAGAERQFNTEAYDRILDNPFRSVTQYPQ